MPRIAPAAQRTIQGRIRVQVTLNVDETGKVTEASLRSPGPSRYFARQALDAARGWRFKPPLEDGQAIASQWLVKFTFSQRGTDESAEQIKP